MRNTKQRKLVLDIINNSYSHPTAEDVDMKFNKVVPKISLWTVYRNLTQLTEHGFIAKLSIPNQSDRFDRNIKPHAHLICEKCHNIFDIESNSINKFVNSLSDKENIEISNYDIQSTIHR